MGTNDTAGQTPTTRRFSAPINTCQVQEKNKLNTYRQLWLKWMSWYERSPGEPHSIESQIHRMIFDDLTYRAILSVRESVAAETAISARSSTLAYLTDRGYFLSQVLAIQKLLDNGSDVISVRRLLKDVEAHRDVITREVYVSGDGHPYDYNCWPEALPPGDPGFQIFGFGHPRLAAYAVSKELHETFDILSAKETNQRSRQDTIRPSVFKTLNGWIDVPSANEIEHIRNNFIAHSADAFKRGTYQFEGVKFSQIDELQRAIIRVERALTDCILSIRIAREVVPFKPLGIFANLNLPYAPLGAQDLMHKRWDELEEERNAWKNGILEEMARSRPK
jgi:hypothetical protein